MSITYAVRSYAVFLIVGVEFVSGKAGANDSAKKHGTFLLWSTF